MAEGPDRGGGVVAMITALLVADSMPSVTKTISLTLAAMLLLWAIPTSVIGEAVAAYLPPLKPFRDASVLGRRGVDFGKWTLAVAALFGTTMFGATTSSMVNAATAGNDLIDAVLSVEQLIAVLAGSGAFFYWPWIPVDLWRAGRRRIAASLRAANAYNRWAAEHDGVELPPAAARLAAFAVRSASGIFFAFYTFHSNGLLRCRLGATTQRRPRDHCKLIPPTQISCRDMRGIGFEAAVVAHQRPLRIQLGATPA